MVTGIFEVSTNIDSRVMVSDKKESNVECAGGDRLSAGENHLVVLGVFDTMVLEDSYEFLRSPESTVLIENLSPVKIDGAGDATSLVELKSARIKNNILSLFSVLENKFLDFILKNIEVLVDLVLVIVTFAFLEILLDSFMSESRFGLLLIYISLLGNPFLVASIKNSNVLSAKD